MDFCLRARNRSVRTLLCASFLLVLPIKSACGKEIVVKGVVFEDQNGNKIQDTTEPGISGVAVSNGRDVTVTDRSGLYKLPALDEMVVFISQPATHQSPLNERMLPQFYYLHQPLGSPSNIKAFAGIKPTGKLPSQINFPLYPKEQNENFSAQILGDTQVTNSKEVKYLRDSVVTPLAASTKGSFVMTLGDNVYNHLNVYAEFMDAMQALARPIYMVPGNHDINHDSADDKHSLETYKSHFGPSYYSFNYGKAHFMVLDTVFWEGKNYRGEIDAMQLTWLQNDLRQVPLDHTIVLAMHVPLQSWVNRVAENGRHMVANREQLFKILQGRKVLALSGHTHTLEQILPGDQYEGWGQPAPFMQITAGAVCGGWWGGRLNQAGVPLAYMRDGTPPGYLQLTMKDTAFHTSYEVLAAEAHPVMHLSLASKEQKLAAPVTSLTFRELGTTQAIINFWNGSSKAKVLVQLDGGLPQAARHDFTTADPFLTGADPKLANGPSTHIWSFDLPPDLAPGAHKITAQATDLAGKSHTAELLFKVTP
jgi:hypothetical protein